MILGTLVGSDDENGQGVDVAPQYFAAQKSLQRRLECDGIHRGAECTEMLKQCTCLKWAELDGKIASKRLAFCFAVGVRPRVKQYAY